MDPVGRTRTVRDADGGAHETPAIRSSRHYLRLLITWFEESTGASISPLLNSLYLNPPLFLKGKTFRILLAEGNPK